MQGLGYLSPNGYRSQAYGISRNGSVIVGTSQSNGAFGPEVELLSHPRTRASPNQGADRTISQPPVPRTPGRKRQQGQSPKNSKMYSSTSHTTLSSLPSNPYMSQAGYIC